MKKQISKIFLAFNFLLVTCAITQAQSNTNSCNGCKIPNPVPVNLATCIPTITPSPTCTPTKTATPLPTIVPTTIPPPTTPPCYSTGFDKTIGTCSYHCTRQTCGTQVSESCGPAYYCCTTSTYPKVSGPYLYSCTSQTCTGTATSEACTLVKTCPPQWFNYWNACGSACYYPGYATVGGGCTYSNSYQCIRDACQCFHPETKILMADGKEKLARDIQGGEFLLNPILGRAMKIKGVWGGPEKPAMYQITAGEQILTVTHRHPLVIVSNEPPSKLDIASSKLGQLAIDNFAPESFGEIHGFVMRQSRHVKVGDEMLTADGKIATISAINQVQLPETEKVYNFDLDADPNDPAQHLIVANGVITGDGVLENKGYDVIKVQE